jgi:DnaJ-class molecular chaperone
VKVVTPKKLTREQKKLLGQLAASLPGKQLEPTPVSEHDDKGIFDRVKDIFA